MSDRRRIQREKQRRYRQRLEADQIICPVAVTPEIIGLLLDLRWLAKDRSEDRRAIGDAIARMLADTACDR